MIHGAALELGGRDKERNVTCLEKMRWLEQFVLQAEGIQGEHLLRITKEAIDC